MIWVVAGIALSVACMLVAYFLSAAAAPGTDCEMVADDDGQMEALSERARKQEEPPTAPGGRTVFR